MNYSLLWKPVPLIAAVKSRVSNRNAMTEAIHLSEQRFKNDPNYRLDLVQDSFAPRPGLPQDDSAILRRIATAY